MVLLMISISHEIAYWTFKKGTYVFLVDKWEKNLHELMDECCIS